MHMHLSGWSPSNISQNVIVNSNQRCIMIHETNGVTVDNNVCYDIKGHGIATETGKEQNNLFKHNLVARNGLLGFPNGQSDSNGAHNKHQAASYWIRNFNNEFIGNVAAGSISSARSKAENAATARLLEASPPALRLLYLSPETASNSGMLERLGDINL